MSLAIGQIIAKQLIGYAIKHGLNHIFRNEQETYQNALTKIIDNTIEDYSKLNPIQEKEDKFPFYKSQIIIDDLLKYRFFKDNNYLLDENYIQQELSANPNIIVPTNKEIKQFVEIFEEKLKEVVRLKELAIKDNYQEEIFHISIQFGSLFERLDLIEKNTEEIKKIIKNKVIISDGIPKELNNIKQRDKKEIVGRKKELKNIRDNLLNNKECILMNGMGGIGKTTLAEVYVKSFYPEYNHIVWLGIEDNLRDTILSDFVLLRNLRLEDVNHEQRFDVCLNDLKNLKGPNLLIIDNATKSLSKFYNQLPKTPDWHILITSRERIEPFTIIDIDFLNERDAVTLFKKHYKSFTKEQIQKIVRLVELHTLTIEVLAKATNRNKWNFEKCLGALGIDAKVDVSNSHSEHKRVEKIKSYLVKTFNASSLGENDKWILQQFTALPTAYIDYDFLYKLLQVDNLDWKDEFHSYLEGLFEIGFLQKNIKNESYKLHAVLKDVLQVSLNPTIDDIDILISSVINLLNIDQDKDNPIEKFPFITYGDAIINLFINNTNHEIAILKNNLALVYKISGDLDKARSLYEEALISELENFGEKHTNVASCQSNLAIVYSELGNYEKAKNLLEEALKSDMENYGKKHPSVTICQSNLALIYQELGNYEKARNLLEKALKSEFKTFGNNHPNVATIRSNLGYVLYLLGDYQKACDLLESALKSDLENVDLEHPKISTNQSILALIYIEIDKYDKALKLLKSALKSTLKNFGEKHPSTAIISCNLALVYQKKDENEKARKLLESALKSDLENFGENHPNVAKIRSNLGYVLYKLGYYNMAYELCEKAVNIQLENFGEEHPTTAIVLSNFALVVKELGKCKKAMELWTSAYNIFNNSLGVDHPYTKKNLNYIEILKKETK